MALSIRRALALACAAPLMGVAAPAASQTLTLASAIEQTLASNPELVNESAYEKGWMVVIEVADASKVNDLMDAAAYKKHLEAH